MSLGGLWWCHLISQLSYQILNFILYFISLSAEAKITIAIWDLY